MIEYFLQLLGTLVETEEALYNLFAILAAVTVTALCLGIGVFFLGAIDPVRSRLRWLGGKKEQQNKNRLGELSRAMGSVSEYVVPAKETERNQISAKLTQAGYRSQNAMTSFYGAKTLLATIFPLVALAATRMASELSSTAVIFIVVAASFIGLTLPNLYISRAHKKRMRSLRHGFPDALDLMVVCVESGLGLTAAFQRVAHEQEISYPELAQEMELVNVEIRAGVSRVDALKNLSDRTGLEDIQGLVSLLIQSMKFGTSIADTLRVYSEEFRDRRMQQAEEKAAKMGTLMIFPLVLCMFPAFFIVSIGPAVLRLIKVFSAT